MKSLIYIGNKLSNKGKTPTSIETLGLFLSNSGFTVITSSSMKNKGLRVLDMLITILKNRKKTDYVLIDTYSTLNFYYAYLTSQLCRVLKINYVPILRGGYLKDRLKKSPKLSESIFKNAYVNIAPSTYLMSKFRKSGYKNVINIPNTIELKNYAFKHREIKKIKLLWVRSFSKIYNPKLAVKILKELKKESLEAELCMVGPDKDGSLLETKKFAENLGLKVKFKGKLSKKAWIELSEEYNIFVNTTNVDNTPVSVIEAMALGLPVISTNVGGIPFLIDNGKNGILVDPNDEYIFMDAINKLVENTTKTKELVLSARKKVESFDWNVVKYQWISILK